MLGGLFSVTLSVTRDSHPGYPRFHEAYRPVVFGLSSGWKYIKPAIAYHIGDNIMDSGRDPAPAFECSRRPACLLVLPRGRGRKSQDESLFCEGPSLHSSDAPATEGDTTPGAL
jgi:hypothetical protein